MHHLTPKCIFLFLSILLCEIAFSQQVIWEETFDVPPAPTEIFYEGMQWEADGKADQGIYWNNRPAIFSESGGGALVMDADHISSNLGQQPFGILGIQLGFQNLPGIHNFERVFLKFNQYFRNFNAFSVVEITSNDGNTFLQADIYDNSNIGDNVESSYKDQVVIEISDFILETGFMEIFFIFDGPLYFWILDDIQIIGDDSDYPCEIVWGNVPGEGDFNGGLNGWTTQAIGPSTALWTWEADGKANLGGFASGFGDLSILSPTLSNGAMVFDSDFYDNGGDTMNLGGGPDPAIQMSELISPPIDLYGIPSGELILKFNQYFRQGMSNTMVSFSFDDGNNWTAPDTINQNLAPGEATERFDSQSIPFNLPFPLGTLRVKFIIDGNYYFWIIDDVLIGRNTLYPETFPPYIGDSLLTYGIPYDVDCLKGPYVPNQLIVQFSPGTSEMDKQILRDSFGVASVDSCMCSVIELWHFGPDTSASPGPGPSGPTAGILEKKQTLGSAPEVDGSDLNKFVWNELQGSPPPVFGPLTTLPSLPPSTNDVLIALLDTGIDYNHPMLNSVIWSNPSESIGDSDIDGSCLPGDVLGWNFVKDNNNPNDDHSHGTHLAGIISENLDNIGQCGNYRIMPLKTHNENGVAELFDIVCAFYYALRQGADVINCSWGWYDTPSEILANLLDSATMNYNTLAIAAAGNDTIDLLDHPQFPACDSAANMLSVAAVDTTGGNATFAGFSNFDPACVDIAAPGVEIMSTLPQNGTGPKSGTSMSAPAVTAAAAKIYCSDPFVSWQEVKNCLLDEAILDPSLGNLVSEGRILNLNAVCIVPVSNPEIYSAVIEVFPNPSAGMVNITSDIFLINSRIAVYDLSGKLIHQKELGDLPAGNTFEIDLKDMASGMYIIRIQSADGIWVKKLSLIKP